MTETNTNRVDTFCGTCLFAKYDDEHKQVGCEAAMLERFKEQGKAVVHTETPDGYRFCVIQDCICYYWRPFDWRPQEEDIEKLVKIAREEITLTADIIIYCDKNTTFDEVEDTIKSINNMTLKPVRVYFANDHMVTPGEFVMWARTKLDMSWRVESVIVEYDSFLRAVDAVVDKCTSRYISIFRAGFIISKDFLKSIDKALHDDLDKFVYLKPIDSINGMTYQRNLHELLGGNKKMSIQEKIEKLTEEQKCQTMIKQAAAFL